MKRTILLVLMAIMISTTCFAQEIEPEGLLGVDGTLWQSVKSFGNVDYTFKITYGFVNGQVYFGFSWVNDLPNTGRTVRFCATMTHSRKIGSNLISLDFPMILNTIKF